MRLAVDVGEHLVDRGGHFLLAFQTADLFAQVVQFDAQFDDVWLRSFTSGSMDSDGGVFSVMVPSSKLLPAVCVASALGQKQTCAAHKPMSALCQ